MSDRSAGIGTRNLLLILTGLVLALGLIVLLVFGGGSGSSEAETGFVPAPPTPKLTPLLIDQEGSAVRPVEGSDGKVHVLYALTATNPTTLDLRVTSIELLDGDGSLDKFGPKQAARMVEVIGPRESSGIIGPSQAANIFVTAAFDSEAEVPDQITHRVTVTAPPFDGPQTTTGAATKISEELDVPVLGPPLEDGQGYIAADGCCESTRHIRAPLPLDNKLWFGQRYAIDWEQVDAKDRVVTGDTSKVENYEIYGKKALAVTDARVVSVIDGLPDNEPGTLPGTKLALDEVDGNSVVLDIGNGLYAMYAHLQAESISVKEGEKVEKGQVLGLVGSSGNSMAPHLHFQVNDGPSPLAANGVPYVIDEFEVSGQGKSTEDFDDAEAGKGPLTIVPASGANPHLNQMPLDLSIVSFGGVPAQK